MMWGQYMLEHVIPDMKRRESRQKRPRTFEVPIPSFEPVDTSSRAPDPKKPKNTLSQSNTNGFQESNNLIAKLHEGTQNQRTDEIKRLYEMNTNLAAQNDVLKIERKSLEHQLEECRSKLVKAESELARKENKQPQSTSSSSESALKRKLAKTYLHYVRAASARKALVYQKKYLLAIIGDFQETKESTLKLISKNQPSEDLAVTPKKKPIMRFRAAVRVCIAVHRYVHPHFSGHSLIILFRLKFLREKWRNRIIRTRSSSKDAVYADNHQDR